MAKLKTSSNQICTIILYKIDTGSYGNIMAIHIFKMLFSRVKKELVATKRNHCPKNVQQKIAFTQLGICKVKIEHNNKQNKNMWVLCMARKGSSTARHSRDGNPRCLNNNL